MLLSAAGHWGAASGLPKLQGKGRSAMKLGFMPLGGAVQVGDVCNVEVYGSIPAVLMWCCNAGGGAHCPRRLLLVFKVQMTHVVDM